jgi:hypothetical protein
MTTHMFDMLEITFYEQRSMATKFHLIEAPLFQRNTTIHRTPLLFA